MPPIGRPAGAPTSPAAARRPERHGPTEASPRRPHGRARSQNPGRSPAPECGRLDRGAFSWLCGLFARGASSAAAPRRGIRKRELSAGRRGIQVAQLPRPYPGSLVVVVNVLSPTPWCRCGRPRGRATRSAPATTPPGKRWAQTASRRSRRPFSKRQRIDGGSLGCHMHSPPSSYRWGESGGPSARTSGVRSPGRKMMVTVRVS